MSDSTYHFEFTTPPKAMVTDRPTKDELEIAKDQSRMLFVIIPDLPVSQDKKNIDMFVDGYLVGCGISRSAYMTIFFNDTGLEYEEVREQFLIKYKNMKFPNGIRGYTTLASGKFGNLLSSFIGKPISRPVVEAPTEEKLDNSL